jgi:iron-sulfur cluster repair protein YtfE (RIC family)
MDLDLSNDPIALLMDDHQRVAEVFDALATSEPGQRTGLVELLGELLETHMRLEEEHLYPVVRRSVGEEEADEAAAEHALAREGLEKVMALQPDRPGFDGAVESLRAGVMHHVEEEEGEIFPKLQRDMNEDARQRLGAALQPLRESLEESGHLGAGITEEELEAAKGRRDR